MATETGEIALAVEVTEKQLRSRLRGGDGLRKMLRLRLTVKATVTVDIVSGYSYGGYGYGFSWVYVFYVSATCHTQQHVLFFPSHFISMPNSLGSLSPLFSATPTMSSSSFVIDCANK